MSLRTASNASRLPWISLMRAFKAPLSWRAGTDGFRRQASVKGEGAAAPVAGLVKSVLPIFKGCQGRVAQKQPREAGKPGNSAAPAGRSADSGPPLRVRPLLSDPTSWQAWCEQQVRHGG